MFEPLKYTPQPAGMQLVLAAAEAGDSCAVCIELEAFVQKRRSLGAAAAPIGTALDYIGQGLAVVPIPHRSKRPTIEDWPNLRITEETAPGWFNGEAQNIGVLLGEASGGLADIDLDCAEAIDAAPAFLARTRTFGRASKRCSHWLYKTGLVATEDVATIKFQDTQKPARIILEICIGGGGKAAQTVFPGSIHPSGEAIEWEDRREVAAIDGNELKRICARISACALLARAYPQQGGRHEGAIIVAGFLCRCGFAAPDIKLFVDTLAGVTCQPPDKRRDMVRAAADTAEAFAAGRNTFGLPKMIDVFGEPVAKKCVEWLGYRAEARGANGERAAEARAADGFARGDAGQILKGHPENIRHAVQALDEAPAQARRLPLGRRPPGSHQPLPRRAQRRGKTLHLDRRSRQNYRRRQTRAPSVRFDPKALDGAALVADLMGWGRGGRTMPDLSDLRHGCHPPARLQSPHERYAAATSIDLACRLQGRANARCSRAAI